MHKASIAGAGCSQQTGPAASPSLAAATDLRQVMKGCAATVVIVTTADSEQARYAMTASSFTSVALEPPTVLICVNKSASLYAPLRQQMRFCINILQARHADLAQTCSSGARTQERFAYHGWRFEPATGLPYLADAQATLFCTLQECLEVASHVVVIGSVQRAIQQAEAAPLLYGDGRYGHWR